MSIVPVAVFVAAVVTPGIKIKVVDCITAKSPARSEHNLNEQVALAAASVNVSRTESIQALCG